MEDRQRQRRLRVYRHITLRRCTLWCDYADLRQIGGGQSKNKGKALIIDMVPQGEGRYTGKVWRPSNDKTFDAEMVLSGNSVLVRGCVAGGLFCSKRTFERLS